MLLTIIKQEGVVVVDGVAYSGIDLAQLAETIHAVQWDGVAGEIEHKDPVTKKMTSNESITSIDQFQFAVDLWVVADALAKVAAEELARQVLEAQRLAEQATQPTGGAQ